MLRKVYMSLTIKLLSQFVKQTNKQTNTSLILFSKTDKGEVVSRFHSLYFFDSCENERRESGRDVEVWKVTLTFLLTRITTHSEETGDFDAFWSYTSSLLFTDLAVVGTAYATERD